MSADILNFPAGGTGSKADFERRFERVRLFGARLADADGLAAELGSAEEWTQSALQHLRLATMDGRAEGSVEVSAAAIQLVLRHVECLEAEAGRRPPQGAA